MRRLQRILGLGPCRSAAKQSGFPSPTSQLALQRFQAVFKAQLTTGHPGGVPAAPSLSVPDEEPRQAEPDSPPGSKPADSASSTLVRPLYRALLTRGRQLEGEFRRLKSTDLFSSSELAWLLDHAPLARQALAQGKVFFQIFLSDAFRAPSESKQGLNARLDLAFSALSMFSTRLHLLQSHAVSPSSDTLSQGIRVIVHSHFNVPDSSRKGGLYHYAVTVRNESHGEPVKLMSRHWRITEFEGRTTVVIGPGVIGQQPVLEEGSEYDYTSFTPLISKRGTQRGTFAMLGLESQELFDVDIGPFALVPPPGLLF